MVYTLRKSENVVKTIRLSALHGAQPFKLSLNCALNWSLGNLWISQQMRVKSALSFQIPIFRCLQLLLKWPFEADISEPCPNQKLIYLGSSRKVCSSISELSGWKALPHWMYKECCMHKARAWTCQIEWSWSQSNIIDHYNPKLLENRNLGLLFAVVFHLSYEKNHPQSRYSQRLCLRTISNIK